MTGHRRNPLAWLVVALFALAAPARAGDPDVDRLIELLLLPYANLQTYGEVRALDERIVRRGSGVLPAVLGNIGHKNPMIRARMAYFVGAIGDPAGVEPVIPLLDDASWIVQESAARALGKMKDPRPVEPLMQVGRSGARRSSVRAEALFSLGAIGDPRAAMLLVRLLANELDPIVRDAAAGGLHAMTGQSFGDDAKRWVGWIGQNHPDWIEMGGPTRLHPAFRYILWVVALFILLGLAAFIRALRDYSR